MSDLEKDFTAKLQQMEQEATHYKRQFSSIWHIVFVLTWVPLIACLLLMAFNVSPSAWLQQLIRWTLVVIAGISAVLTIYQSFFRVRGRWLVARAGSEILNNLYWRYRANVTPFAGSPNPAALLQQKVDSVWRSVYDPAERYTFRNLWRMLRAAPRNEQRPPLKKSLNQPLTFEEYQSQRFEDQHTWFLRRAKENFIWFFAIQTGIVGFSSLILFWNAYQGYSIHVAALAYGVNLALLCLREFKRCWDLMARYLTVAVRMNAKLEFYRESLATTPHESEQHSQTLVGKVEDLLAREVVHWYAAQGSGDILDMDM